MPQHAPSPRVCHHCDGFATATVTTGTRHPDGTRNTLPVACPSCKGTGHSAPASTGALATVRR
jgi:DnaJ-class molecular chaperone